MKHAKSSNMLSKLTENPLPTLSQPTIAKPKPLPADIDTIKLNLINHFNSVIDQAIITFQPDIGFILRDLLDLITASSTSKILEREQFIIQLNRSIDLSLINLQDYNNSEHSLDDAKTYQLQFNTQHSLHESLWKLYQFLQETQDQTVKKFISRITEWHAECLENLDECISRKIAFSLNASHENLNAQIKKITSSTGNRPFENKLLWTECEKNISTAEKHLSGNFSSLTHYQKKWLTITKLPANRSTLLVKCDHITQNERKTLEHNIKLIHKTKKALDQALSETIQPHTCRLVLTEKLPIDPWGGISGRVSINCNHFFQNPYPTEKKQETETKRNLAR